ncbi:ABC transporter permease [Actibacterium ureilyticum]|uniref:ABC transporter permease n=1 Tax=Actibacterium ureilyticum TaxID=1590614 RepID=UPI000BAAFC72|nr:FtsX-like permease family protein [Actibacterium ureilyticum]
MSLRQSARLAGRELRGGLRGFYVFLVCLALGVAAIAAVGTVRESVEQGMRGQGAVLLGGDAELRFTYRFASDEERDWMRRNADAVSEIVDFRSMAVVGAQPDEERALTQVKGVDDAWPLYGQPVLDPPMSLADALAGNGAVMDRVLVDRLGLRPGDTFRLGTAEYELRAILAVEPDSAGSGFSLGPRTIVRTAALDGSGLLAPGTLYESRYRLKLPEGSDLAALEAQAEALFRDTGLRWRDSRNAAPGLSRFVERMGAFLVLVGLAGLAVGGVGVSAAVRSYLDGKTAVIATLKTLGATRRVIFLTYFLQIGALAVLGIAAGVVLGGTLPLLLAPLIAAKLPLPVDFALQPGALAEAALYGLLTALIFTLWPLSRAQGVRAAALYRDAAGGVRGRPGLGALAAIALSALALVVIAAQLSGVAYLTYWAAAGIVGALVILWIASFLVRRLARRAARSAAVRGHPALRLALGAVAGPGGEAASVVLSLGLGLSVLAAVGQIDTNLRAAISGELPEVAPSYFMVDIQPDQLAGFLDRTGSDPGISRVDTAPMLRGVITRINGKPAREVAGNHWVLRGDRGVTYAAAPPPNTRVTQGDWWPADYTGEPLMSFAEEEALEMGLKLGDRVTVNILGRDITARITSFREVDFSTAGIGFVMVLDPAALQGAPHTHIATVYADAAAEAPLLRDLARAYPNLTAIRVRDAVDRVAGILGGMASAITYGALASLVAGFFVLIGAAAAGLKARVFEASVLKVLGAERLLILRSFALRAVILGAAAGLVAVLAGGLAGWAVMRFVMEADFHFEPLSAALIVGGGIAATLLAGLAFAWPALAGRPAQVLRGRE